METQLKLLVILFGFLNSILFIILPLRGVYQSKKEKIFKGGVC